MWTGLLLMCLKTNPVQCMPFVSVAFYSSEEECLTAVLPALQELALTYPNHQLADTPVCVEWYSEGPNV